jgi:hypothetical protein
LCPGALFSCLALAAGLARAQDPEDSFGPAGVCYPVEGEGYMVPQDEPLRIPIGTLSPLYTGDSLVVLSGSITFYDFRTGEQPTFGGGTRMVIPPVFVQARPSWWDRLRDRIFAGLNDPELTRVSVSVRDPSMPAFWPDSARIAPDLSITFQWSGVNPPPAALWVLAGPDTLGYPVAPSVDGHGVFVRPAEKPLRPGAAKWVLLGEGNVMLAERGFVVLTPAEAESERRRFLQAAETTDGPESPGFRAAVLAKSERTFLW